MEKSRVISCCNDRLVQKKLLNIHFYVTIKVKFKSGEKVNIKECSVCHKNIKFEKCTPFDLINDSLSKFIQKEELDFKDGGYICDEDLNSLRMLYIKKSVESESGEISKLENEVLESLKEQELLSENLNSEKNSNCSFAENLSDKMASFGGSWTFIIFFGSVLFFLG